MIQRSVTSNTIALAGAALGWQIPATVSSVQEYVAWLNDPANGLVGSEIKLTIDGVEVTRRIQSFDLKRADGSVSMGIYQPDNYLSLVLDDTVTLKHYYVRDGSDTVVAQQLPSELTFGLTGLGKGDNKGEIAYAIRRGLGATALMQGSLAVDSRSAWGWWGNQNLTFYQYTETTTGGAARYGNYVSLGNGFSWDLSASNLSDGARIQMLNAIKSLLASGQNISLTGLDLFMTNDGTTRTGHQLGVYDNGKLKIVSVVDEFGNPLTAQSPDSAWLKGRIVFAGDVYAEESQLKALYAYRNLDTNDPNWSQKPIDLGGMVVNAGIRLVDSGFAQQSLAAKGAASLTLAGNDALTRGQRVELSFAGSSQTLVYYIKSVNGRVVTLADTADNAFLPNGEALTLEQILKAVGATPGAISVRLLDASASGASVATDDVITLTKTDIVPVLDAAGNVTGYRNLQNYDRVYLNDALAKDGKTISLQNNVAYYVLVESGNRVRLFASKEQAMLYQQFEQLKQTPDGQALIKSLFTDAGIMPQLLTGFAAANLRGMFTVSTHLFQAQAVADPASLSAQMQALHEQFKNQAYDPNHLPSSLNLAGVQDLVKSVRNQVVYDYAVNKELAQTAEYHNYWRERLTSTVGASSALTGLADGSFKLANMFIVDDGKGGLRALATGDEIYFRDAVGGLRADTAYYAIVGADGSIRLAATLADAMLYQTGAGQNDALLALYPGMGKAVTVDFKAADLASAQAYVRNYVQKTDAPAQTADEIALYGSSYRTGYFFYFSAATLRNIENNLLYPVSATINEKVFDIDSQSEGVPPADRFLNVKAGQGITLRTSGQGSIGAQLGEYTLKLPDLCTISGDQRANIFDALPEADKAILSRANAANLAGVYHTLYRYIGPAGTVSLDRAHVDFTDASLWRAVNPMFSNDAALQLGARLAAGTELQFLFADRFGLFENSREVFVYNSRMLEGATGGQLAQLQANIAAARTAGLQVVDIGSGFLDPVWKAVDVPFVAQDGASAQQLKTGALVGDMRDPRYLTINLTRSLAVQAVDGVVSAYSDTTVGLDSPRAASAWATSMPPRASPSRSAPRAVPSSAPTRVRWRARARSAWSPIATSWEHPRRQRHLPVRRRQGAATQSGRGPCALCRGGRRGAGGAAGRRRPEPGAGQYQGHGPGRLQLPGRRQPARGPGDRRRQRHAAGGAVDPERHGGGPAPIRQRHAQRTERAGACGAGLCAGGGPDRGAVRRPAGRGPVGGRVARAGQSVGQR